jgi:hypothetical protein
MLLADQLTAVLWRAGYAVEPPSLAAALQVERYARKPAPGQRSLFREEDHPRGQPENAGEFVKKGEGQKSQSKQPEERQSSATNSGDPIYGVARATHDYLENWMWGDWSKTPHPLPTDEVIADLAQFVPAKPVKLYRAGFGGDDPKAGLKSWTTNREYAQEMVDFSKDPEMLGYNGRPRKLMAKTFWPNEILVDMNRLPEEYRKKAAIDEVIVAYGPTLKHMQALRGNAPPQKQPNAAPTPQPQKATPESPTQQAASTPERQKAERSAAKWVYGWRGTPGSKTLPKNLPLPQAAKIIQESRPKEPVMLYRWERVDHDATRSDMPSSVPLQSWTKDGETAAETVQEVNEDIDRGLLHQPKMRLLTRVFQPHEVYADFENLPQGVKDHMREMGSESDNLSEVLVWKQQYITPQRHSLAAALQDEMDRRVVRYAFDESKINREPKGSEQGGEFAEKQEGDAPTAKSLATAAHSGAFSRTAAKKQAKAAGIHAEFLAALKALDYRPAEPEPTTEQKAEHARLRAETIKRVTASAPLEIQDRIEEAVDIIGYDESDDKILAEAESLRAESEEASELAAKEKEAVEREYAEWEKKKAALDETQDQIFDTLIKHGWQWEIRNAASGSRYIEAVQWDETADETRSLKIRLADHYAPAGAGFDQGAQGYNEIPDVDLVYEGEPVDVSEVAHAIEHYDETKEATEAAEREARKERKNRYALRDVIQTELNRRYSVVRYKGAGFWSEFTRGFAQGMGGGRFEEAKHPRGGKGTQKGGQFVSKGQGGGGPAKGKQSKAPNAPPPAQPAGSYRSINVNGSRYDVAQKGKDWYARPQGKQKEAWKRVNPKSVAKITDEIARQDFDQKQRVAMQAKRRLASHSRFILDAIKAGPKNGAALWKAMGIPKDDFLDAYFSLADAGKVKQDESGAISLIAKAAPKPRERKNWWKGDLSRFQEQLKVVQTLPPEEAAAAKAAKKKEAEAREEHRKAGNKEAAAGKRQETMQKADDIAKQLGVSTKTLLGFSREITDAKIREWEPMEGARREGCKLLNLDADKAWKQEDRIVGLDEVGPEIAMMPEFRGVLGNYNAENETLNANQSARTEEVQERLMDLIRGGPIPKPGLYDEDTLNEAAEYIENSRKEQEQPDNDLGSLGASEADDPPPEDDGQGVDMPEDWLSPSEEESVPFAKPGRPQRYSLAHAFRAEWDRRNHEATVQRYALLFREYYARGGQRAFVWTEEDEAKHPRDEEGQFAEKWEGERSTDKAEQQKQQQTNETPETPPSPPPPIDVASQHLSYSEERHAAHKLGLDISRGWAKQLSPTEQADIGNYRDGGYQNINNYLRKGVVKQAVNHPPDHPGASLDVRKAVKSLDEAIAKSPPLSHPIACYRGMRGHLAKQLIEATAGDIVEDKGFVSTTLFPQYAYTGFAREAPEKTVARIIIPAGIRAAYFSQDGTEMELVLPRGTKFRIVGREPVEVFGEKYTRFDMEAMR